MRELPEGRLKKPIKVKVLNVNILDTTKDYNEFAYEKGEILYGSSNHIYSVNLRNENLLFHKDELEEIVRVTKMYVSSSDIKKTLDSGYKVWSGMLGRVGWVEDVNDGMCKIKLHKKLHGCTHGLTTFECGDEAEMTWDYVNGNYVIGHVENDFE